VVPQGEGKGEALLEVADQLNRKGNLRNKDECLSVAGQSFDRPGVDLGLAAPRHSMEKKGFEFGSGNGLGQLFENRLLL